MFLVLVNWEWRCNWSSQKVIMWQLLGIIQCLLVLTFPPVIFFLLCIFPSLYISSKFISLLTLLGRHHVKSANSTLIHLTSASAMHWIRKCLFGTVSLLLNNHHLVQFTILFSRCCNQMWTQISFKGPTLVESSNKGLNEK